MFLNLHTLPNHRDHLLPSTLPANQPSLPPSPPSLLSSFLLHPPLLLPLAIPLLRSPPLPYHPHLLFSSYLFSPASLPPVSTPALRLHHFSFTADFGAVKSEYHPSARTNSLTDACNATFSSLVSWNIDRSFPFSFLRFSSNAPSPTGRQWLGIVGPGSEPMKCTRLRAFPAAAVDRTKIFRVDDFRD